MEQSTNRESALFHAARHSLPGGNGHSMRCGVAMSDVLSASGIRDRWLAFHYPPTPMAPVERHQMAGSQ
ncbi:hypothetical protein AB4144_56535, partial [Rhizobiaceae sp. 2RAB30]